MSIFYITKATALAHGMTHEGRLFGVPAWMTETAENEVVAAPKIPILQFWCCAIDYLMEFATYFMIEDDALVTPITILRPIQ